MSKPKPGVLFMQAWVSELSGVSRKPSWIARKRSTRPPVRSGAPAANASSSPAPREDAPPSAEAQARLEPSACPPPALPQPPPPPAVDLATSVALAQLADENAALRAQVTEMAATMARLEREVLEASEQDLLKLALTIAERVIGRELAVDPSLPAAWAREAIEALAARDGVVISVAKDVRETVPEQAWEDTAADRVQTDPQLASGIVEVRTAEGSVVTGAAPRLAAVAEALGAEGA